MNGNVDKIIKFMKTIWWMKNDEVINIGYAYYSSIVRAEIVRA